MRARAPAGIARAAVLGAGSMGGGIAAQFANAGVPVLLFDLDRAAVAKGLARQRKAGALMRADRAELIEPAGIDRDLPRLVEADWIVEAVPEDLALKRDLYARIEAVRRDGAVVSSNTSTIPLVRLTEGLGARFARDFLVTHFFNPVRHMRLMELVAGPETRPAAVATVRGAADRLLGKTVIDCRDTPAFIANRLGCFWMSVAVLEALRLGLTVEQADAAAGRPFGVPPTGVFGLCDLVGIDLIPDVWSSLLAALPPDDPHQAYDLTAQRRIRAMIAAGQTGRKGGGGFYRDRAREALDLTDGRYRPAEAPPSLPPLADLIGRDDALGRYAWAILSGVVGYAAAVAGEIADDLDAIDAAMVLGYNWREGPFALADRVGPALIAQRLRDEGRPVPPLLAAAAETGGFRRDGQVMTTAGDWQVPRRPAGVLRLDDGAVIEAGAQATLRDLGDGIAVLELHGKVNALAPALLEAIEAAAARRDLAGLVIASRHPRFFSVGADLAHLFACLDDPAALEAYLEQGQRAFRALRAAPVPVVGAPQGLALGGGCELLLHCDAVQAWAEAGLGLVERQVGIIPGWGGCVRLLLAEAARRDRPRGPLPAAASAFATIAAGRAAGSALEAQEQGLLHRHDGITMNRERVLADAKARALTLAEAYAPPAEAEIRLGGPSAALSLRHRAREGQDAGRFDADDLAVLDALAGVLTGGARADPTRPLGEAALYALERAAVLELLRRPQTRARLEAQLE